MSEVLLPAEYETPTALCGLCKEPMIFIGRSQGGSPLFFCDNQQENERMPDDGYAWRNLLQQRIRDSGN